MSNHLTMFVEQESDVSGAQGPLTYGEALLELAKEDERIVCLVADVTGATETQFFRDSFPERFFMMGIQEANMIGVAGGMARQGEVAFVHSFSVFLTRRVYDQIAMQVAYPKTNVKLAGFLPGLTTGLGVSHQAIDDIALMRALPNMTIVEPMGPQQVYAAVRAAYEHEGPVFLRLFKVPATVTDMPLMPLELGRGQILRQGKDVAIIALGLMVDEAMKAAACLDEQGISATVVNMHTVKPLDRQLLIELAETHRAIISAENHTVIGGLGSAIAEVLAEEALAVPLKRIGLQDVFACGGSTPYLFETYGLSSPAIVKAAMETLSGNNNE